MSPLNRLGEVARRFKDAGLRTVSQLLTQVFGERTSGDHERWDEQTRQRAQDKFIDFLSASANAPAKEREEAPPDEVKQLQDLPPIDCGILNESSDHPEAIALRVSDAVRGDEKKLLAPSPQNVLFGLIRIMSNPSIWLAFEREHKLPGLYKAVLEPLAKTMSQVVPYDTLVRLSCQVSRLYRVRVRAVTAEEIYVEALKFVDIAGSGVALTNSTSSGIIDPLERLGTQRLLAALNVSADTEVAQKIAKKSHWREQNFAALLDRDAAARRPYFFDRTMTAQVLRSTIDTLPDHARASYINLAAENLANALECPRFELYEVAKFENWMQYLTRTAPGHTLYSFRHPRTKAITEGIELTFIDPLRQHKFYEQIFGALGLGSLYFGWPSFLLIAACAYVEGTTYFGVDYFTLRQKAEDDIKNSASIKRLYLEGNTQSDRVKQAREYIDSLTAAVVA